MTVDQFQAHLDQRSVNTHDASRVASLFTDDGVQRRMAPGVTARGRDAIRQATQDIFDAFPDLYLEVRNLFSTPERICVQCSMTATQDGGLFGLPPTGRRVEVCLVLRVGADGQVEEEVIYMDNATLLQQLGLEAQR